VNAARNSPSVVACLPRRSAILLSLLASSLPLVRVLLEPRPDNKWRAYFYVTEAKLAGLGETAGSWAHCIGELPKLREGVVAKG
jgi:hypothetical protein